MKKETERSRERIERPRDGRRDKKIEREMEMMR